MKTRRKLPDFMAVFNPRNQWEVVTDALARLCEFTPSPPEPREPRVPTTALDHARIKLAAERRSRRNAKRLKHWTGVRAA